MVDLSDLRIFKVFGSGGWSFRSTSISTYDDITPLEITVPDVSELRNWLIEQFTDKAFDSISAYTLSDGRFRATIEFTDKNAATLTKVFWDGKAAQRS